MQVNRGLKDIIYGSSKVERNLSLVTSPSGAPIWFPFEDGIGGSNGFICKAEEGRAGLDHQNDLRIFAKFRQSYPHLLCEIPARYREMYFCQPTVQEMRPEIRDQHIKMPLLRSTAGLRVGDLFDCHQRLLVAYGHCRIKFTGRGPYEGVILCVS